MRTSLAHQRGFTLIELVVVVGIVAVVVGIALPAMGGARAESKKVEIIHDLIRVARQGRAASAAYGRAHMFRYNSNLYVRGGVELYRGINGNCNTNDWATITTGGCNNNLNCIAHLDPRELENSNSQYTILLNFDPDPDSDPDTDNPTSDGAADICFEPSGITRWRSSPTAQFLSQNPAGNGGGFEFSVQRTANGRITGVHRRMMIPLGGDPRIRR